MAHPYWTVRLADLPVTFCILYVSPKLSEAFTVCISSFFSSFLVRLTWTSTVTGGPEGDVKSVEPGMDIFRRQPDGSWKIMRYLAYSE